jgi:hypothetical protein
MNLSLRVSSIFAGMPRRHAQPAAPAGEDDPAPIAIDGAGPGWFECSRVLLRGIQMQEVFDEIFGLEPQRLTHGGASSA